MHRKAYKNVWRSMGCWHPGLGKCCTPTTLVDWAAGIGGHSRGGCTEPMRVNRACLQQARRPLPSSTCPLDQPVCCHTSAARAPCLSWGHLIAPPQKCVLRDTRPLALPTFASDLRETSTKNVYNLNVYCPYLLEKESAENGTGI